MTERRPFWDLYDKRVRLNQDLVVLIDDHHNRRGTGKTTLSVKLAGEMDRTDEGLTPAKASLDVDEIADQITEQPKQSALILDEAEVGADKYETWSDSNKKLRELISMARVEEKYIILNLPNSGELDPGVKALADVWISVDELGTALVHYFRWHRYKDKLMTPKVAQMSWDPIEDPQLQNVYDALTQEKHEHLHEAGEEQQAATDGGQSQSKATRNERIRDLYDSGVSTSVIAESFDLSDGRISQIVADDDD